MYPVQSVYVARGKQEFSCYRPQEADADDNDANAAAVRAVVAKLDHQLIATRAQFVADCVLDTVLDQVNISVRLVWLQNYVERLAHWAMNAQEGERESTGKTGLFLLQCLYQEEMLEILDEEEGESIQVHSDGDGDGDGTEL